MKICIIGFCLIISSLIWAKELPDFKRNPVVYGISPLYLSYGHSIPGLRAVKNRLAEIKDLGVNIIWLQPITTPFEQDGHGYDVMNYTEVWPVLGTETDLRNLVNEAHRLGIKVMLDVVLNHSSAEHPFVKDIEANGKKSPYYDFYQHEPISGIPYAQHFHERQIGQGRFIHYFWEHLLNFNYESPALRDYLLGSLEHWVKNFGIDGFRFDASWGPSTRWPLFYRTVSERLRSLNPDIILMAEDMAGYPVAYKDSRHPHLRNSGFDWAYDWNNLDPYFISKWAFQLDDEQKLSVFNLESPVEAAEEFHDRILMSNQTEVKPVRYIENNDTPGSLRHHSKEESKWAATTMFLLPGVPLIFYGQEAGNKHDLFELPSFDPSRKMSSYDPELWSFYQRLVKMRKSNPIISEGKITNLRRNLAKVSYQLNADGKILAVELDFKSKSAKLSGIPVRL
ncbi:MAG: alpha-amylase family glycosyl hydrolase [Bdellovibrionota bacterium]